MGRGEGDDPSTRPIFSTIFYHFLPSSEGSAIHPSTHQLPTIITGIWWGVEAIRWGVWW
jgi:hypothetical protein